MDVPVIPVVARPVGVVGAVTSGHGTVDAVTAARAETLPAASKACTPSTWLVPQPRPVKANDVVPALAPSRNAESPVTPTLSVAAADAAAGVVVVAVVVRPVGADGAVVSGQVAVAAVIVERPETFPEASKACTPSVWLVPQPS